MPSLRIIEDDEPQADKDQPLCNICQKQFSNYICPRCNLRYCSLSCYKDMQHAECTESFYKDSITDEIRSRGMSEADKQNMLQLLRRFEAENDELATQDDDNDSVDDLQQRFATIDLDNADTEAIWDLLSEEERKEFEALLSNQESMPLPEYQPWWKEATSQVIQEVGEGPEVSVPKLPSSLPDLEAMMKGNPPGPESDLVWSLMHSVMTYCYLMRHCLGDIREDVKDTVSALSKLSRKTLFSTAPGCAYTNASDATFDLVDDILEYEQRQNSQREPLMLMLLGDFLSLLERHDYVVRAMTDLWQLLELSVKRTSKTERKAYFSASRKAYFYVGYAVYLSRNHGLGRLKLSAMAEREGLLLEEQRFNRERRAAEDAIELQRQTKVKITDAL
ncbi:hypothetical protein BJV82DRAFT_715325 [Fennellomyces sp. T-0311]|nr:hypothetical protein BJV82DRAFT_715325 [Fennellomyces sp. T-0311]